MEYKNLSSNSKNKIARVPVNIFKMVIFICLCAFLIIIYKLKIVQKFNYDNSISLNYMESAPTHTDAAPTLMDNASTFAESVSIYTDTASTFTESAPTFKESASTYTDAATILTEIEESDLIPDLSNTEVPENSIFFLETSHIYESERIFININSRQACSVESAALNHPDKTIFFLFTYPTLLPSHLTQRRDANIAIVKELLKYNNIKLRLINVNNFSENTPLENWFKSLVLKSSIYLSVHASDVLRYLTLWKFGGTYLDTDIILMKSLNSLPPNYAAFQEDNNLNNAVLNLDRLELGKRVSELFLREIRQNFNGQAWGTNGPGLVTKVAEAICKKSPLGKASSNLDCEGFHALPVSFFYSIPYTSSDIIFNPLNLSKGLKMVEESYGVHFWNKMSINTKVNKTASDSLFTAIAKKHCPNVFRESSNIF